MTDNIISNDIFKSIYSNKDTYVNIEDKLVDKIKLVSDSIKNDTCFMAKPLNKPYVKHVSAFNCRFKEEDTKKKTVISLLNKLSNLNIDSIIVKLQNSISKPYDTDIQNIINFMKRDKKNLKNYIQVLKIFPDTSVILYLDSYYEQNINYWLPSDYFIENNVYSTDCPEDIYCEFITWKNGQLVFTELLLFYKDINMINNIVQNILLYIDKNKENIRREHIDPLLEHLNILYQLLLPEDLNKISLIEVISSSTKFKIMDIKKKMILKK